MPYSQAFAAFDFVVALQFDINSLRIHSQEKLTAVYMGHKYSEAICALILTIARSNSFPLRIHEVSTGPKTHSVRPYVIPHITKCEMDSGQKAGYYATTLSGKNDHSLRGVSTEIFIHCSY